LPEEIIIEGRVEQSTINVLTMFPMDIGFNGSLVKIVRWKEK